MIETYLPDAATRADFARRAEAAGRANPEFWGSLPPLPSRPLDGHKGTFGTALVVGGSRGMSGAISLTGSAALVAGAGLTRLFVPEAILETVAGFAREYTTIPGACDEFGRLKSAASEAILREASGATAVAVGPGFGRSAEATRLVVELFFELEGPAVFDADALNALAEAGVFGESAEKNEAISENFAGRKPRGARILTPHPGEFARLTGAKPSGDSAERIAAATSFAKRLERLFVDGARRGNEPEQTDATERNENADEPKKTDAASRNANAVESEKADASSFAKRLERLFGDGARRGNEPAKAGAMERNENADEPKETDAASHNERADDPVNTDASAFAKRLERLFVYGARRGNEPEKTGATSHNANADEPVKTSAMACNENTGGDSADRIAASAFAKRLKRRFGDGARRGNGPEKTGTTSYGENADEPEKAGAMSHNENANGPEKTNAASYSENADEPEKANAMPCNVNAGESEKTSATLRNANADEPEKTNATSYSENADEPEKANAIPCNVNAGESEKTDATARNANAVESEKADAMERNASEGGDSAFVVALKGASTVVADGGGAFFVNETGNPNLATGGSGDVLTGIIVGLLAQGAAPLDATRSAVALHGLASDLRAALCSRGAVASDVVRFLPVAFDFYNASRASSR